MKEIIPNSLKLQAAELVSRVKPYSLAIFLVFVGLSYSFLLFQLKSLSSTEPSPDLVSQQVKGSAAPHIDRAIVKRIQSLQDNSVTVKTLFEQARNNPFQ